MKTIPWFLFAAFVLLAACNNTPATGNAAERKDTAEAHTPAGTQPGSASVDDMVAHYLALKNALAADNGKEAGEAANEIRNSIEQLHTSAFTAEQKRTIEEIKPDIKEHAAHIGDHSSNIEHQRQHFELLSEDMTDLVRATGSSKTLYRDFCPMYNSNKGAYWLSEVKEISNPYLGKKMPGCGEVKEEIRAKG